MKFSIPKVLPFVAVFALTAAACSEDGVAVGSTTEATTETTSATTSGPETAPVTIAGDALAQPPQDGSADPAAGEVGPTLTGVDINGELLEIGADGKPKALVFVAHWCPHCQDEVPVISDLLANGNKPDGMDIYVISTAVFSDRENYPPSAWLRTSGLDAPIMMDSAEFDALKAYGGGGFPYTVYLDSENRVLKRTQGTGSADTIKGLWLETANS